MKRVQNSEVAHLWAKGEDAIGFSKHMKSYCGQLTSYGHYIIGRLKSINGYNIAIINSEKSSCTTERQKSYALHAVRDFDYVFHSMDNFSFLNERVSSCHAIWFLNEKVDNVRFFIRKRNRARVRHMTDYYQSRINAEIEEIKGMFSLCDIDARELLDAPSWVSEDNSPVLSEIINHNYDLDVCREMVCKLRSGYDIRN